MTKTKKAAVKQAPSDDPVEAARAEVEHLNSAELRFGLVYRERSAVLADLRASRGRKVYDADDPSAVVAEVNTGIRTLEDELEGYVDASTEARKARLPAIARVYAAECDAMEAKAAAKDASALKLQAESDRLRDALEIHDSWGYFPAEGQVNGQYVAAVAYGGGPDAGGQFRVVDARGPKHMRLRHEAQALRSRSAQDRFKVAHRAGSAGGDSVEDVISAVHSDAMRIGPSAEDIIAFVESTLDAERRRSRTSSEDAVSTTEPLRIHLVWASGIIDVAQSTVSRLRAPVAGGDVGQQIDQILGEPVGAELKT